MHISRSRQTVLLLLALAVSQGAFAQQGGADERGARRQAPSISLQAAIEAGRWLQSVAIETEHGLTWPTVPDDGPASDHGLYAGTPGIILFMIELNRATDDSRWLEVAARGGDDLIAWMEANDESNAAGLWTGLGGQMFALHQLHRATQEQRFLDAARLCCQKIVKSARMLEGDPRTAYWNDSTDIISGTAGIGLALLYAHEHMGMEDALAVATRAGRTLVQQAIPVAVEDGERNLKWAMSENFPRLMPNFSHGTAGNAYFLLQLHQARRTRDGEFLLAAERGARYLLSIADTSDGRCLIFHHEPAGEELFYLSWCHGPVGTARLFHGLAAATGDASWSTWVDRGVKGIVDLGAPHQRSEGFWMNVGQCCGSAGIGGFAIDLRERAEVPEEDSNRLRRLAQVCAADVLRHAKRINLADGRTAMYWAHAEHRVRPEFLQAQTGYMQGAAGIGMFLLDIHFDERGLPRTVRFPDEPVWASGR